jgi:hypothetical protein
MENRPCLPLGPEPVIYAVEKRDYNGMRSLRCVAVLRKPCFLIDGLGTGWGRK